MRIWGNTVSTNMPRSDYGQTDPSMADFVLNKPVEAIAKAQKTADEAKKTAGDALPKSGGIMTGDIAMSGKRVTGLADPVEAVDAVNKKYVDDKKKIFPPVVLTANGWTGDAAPYTQTVQVEGITVDDNPDYWPVYSGTNDEMIAQKEAFTAIDRLTTADGSITVICFDEKPETDVTIGMEVHR